MPSINRITAPNIELITVPGGEFILGPGPLMTTKGSVAGKMHRVTLEKYEIGRYPVTNAQYRIFIEDTGHTLPLTWEKGYPEGKDNHPVSGVMWLDSWLFCAWLSYKTGQPYHLPTEPEWEKAATWDTVAGQKYAYPWGNEPDKSRCNVLGSGHHDTTPVGFYSPRGDSPIGCADMTGNVDEWCNSVMVPYPYDAADGCEDSTFTGERRALRGGDWYTILSPATRRNAPSEMWAGMWGFRVALGNSVRESHMLTQSRIKTLVGLNEEKRQAAINQSPLNAQYYYDRGTWRTHITDMGLNLDLQAEADFDKAIELAVKYKTLDLSPISYLYFNRARLRLRLKKYELSVSDISRSIKLDPTDPTAYVIRAKAYCELKRWRLAQQDIERAKRIGPQGFAKNAHVLMVQAQISAIRGDTTESIRLYTEIIKRPIFTPPALPEIYWLRAQVYSKIGQDEKALSDYFHFLLWQPDVPESQLVRDWLRG